MAISYKWKLHERVKHIWNNFCVVSLKACPKKTKTSKIYSEITYFFQLLFFSNLKVRYNSYVIELFRLEFAMLTRRHYEQ